MIAPADADTEYTQFKKTVSTLVPLRLDYYKQQQMERRIRDLARKHQAPTLLAFGQMLQRDAALLCEFEQHLTINVSEFFRNPDAFDYLRAKVFPQLLASQGGTRIWSAGCSYGAEPYTLAMMLHDTAPSPAYDLCHRYRPRGAGQSQVGHRLLARRHSESAVGTARSLCQSPGSALRSG